MNLNRILPHEPEEELIGPEDLGISVANLDRAMTHNRLRNLIRDAETDTKINQLLQSLMRTGVCRSEKELIARALETFLVAVAPPTDRDRLLTR